MKKRVLTFILALCMAFGLLAAGCGGEGGSESTGAAESTGSGSQGIAEISGDPVHLTIGVPQNANVTSYTDNAFTRYLEEKANVELEFVYFPSSAEDYIRRLSLMAAAGEEMPDVLWGFNSLDTNSRNEFGMSGYLLDLTDLIEEYAPDYKAALANVTDATRARIESRAIAPDGGIYGLPLTWEFKAWDDLQSMLFINQEWLDTLGLEAPTTVDELYTVLKAFKEKDPNGNGVEDEIPLFGRTVLTDNNIATWIINAYIYFDDSNELNVENGKLYAPFITDEYRQALIFLNKLCKEGLLSDLCFSAGMSEMKAMVTPGTGVAQVGIFAGHPSVYADQNSPVLEQYQPYAGLKDETGKGGYIILHQPTIHFGLMITADCENPEAAMRLCNLFYQDETISRQRHGEKGVDWEEEPGELPYGGMGYIKLLNSNAFFKGNSTWCANGGGIFTSENYAATTTSTRKADAVISQLFKTCYETVMVNASHPDEVCRDLLYTPAIYERRTQYSSSIRNFMISQRNLFILGSIDPNSDADWNNYLSELNTLGLEDYIAIMQEAYDSQ